MSEMSTDSTGGGCEVRRIHRPWYRRTWFLILAFLLAIGLTGIITQFLDAEYLAPQRMNAQVEARAQATKWTLRQLHTAVNQFHMDSGRWPTQSEGLSVLVRQPANVTNWPPGGYLEAVEIPTDGWGRDFILELRPNAGRPFVIKSLGADGAEGGEGYNADLFSIDVR